MSTASASIPAGPPLLNGEARENEEMLVLDGLIGRPEWFREYRKLIEPHIFNDPTRIAIAKLAIKLYHDIGCCDADALADLIGRTNRIRKEDAEYQLREAFTLREWGDDRRTKALAALRREADVEDLKAELTAIFESSASLGEIVEAIKQRIPAYESIAIDPLESRGDQILMRSGNEIVREQVKWLWPQRLALGKLNLIVGAPDQGKTYLALDIGARKTAGIPWPDRRDEPNPVGSVVYCSLEDDASNTLMPRFDNQDGDDSRFWLLDGVADLQIGSDRSFDLECERAHA
jgi:hypothetical protein